MLGWAGSIKLAVLLTTVYVSVASAHGVRRVTTATEIWEMVLHRRRAAAVINAAHTDHESISNWDTQINKIFRS